MDDPQNWTYYVPWDCLFHRHTATCFCLNGKKSWPSCNLYNINLDHEWTNSLFICNHRMWPKANGAPPLTCQLLTLRRHYETKTPPNDRLRDETHRGRGEETSHSNVKWQPASTNPQPRGEDGLLPLADWLLQTCGYLTHRNVKNKTKSPMCDEVSRVL